MKEILYISKGKKNKLTERYKNYQTSIASKRNADSKQNT